MDSNTNNGSKHPREPAAGDGAPKKAKLPSSSTGTGEELRAQTLLELFHGLGSLAGQQQQQEVEALLLDLISEIKRRLAGVEGLQVLLSEQMKPFLESGLTSALPLVRELTLGQLARAPAAGPPGCALLAAVWPAIVRAVADDNLKVASAATAVIVAAAAEPAGLDLIFNHDTETALHAMLSGSEVLRLRLLDLFVELVTHAPKALEQLRRFLDLIAQEADSPGDLLARMNGLELLEKLSKTEQGRVYLCQSGAMASIQRLIANPDADGFSLLCGSALRVLSSIVRHVSNPVSLFLVDDYRGRRVTQQGEGIQLVTTAVFNVVDALLESQDESCAAAAIGFLGALGSQAAGAEVLLSHRAMLKSWFEHMASTVPLLRLSSLHALAELLMCKDHDKTLAVFNLEDKGWNGASTGEVMRTLMRFLDQPFSELRYAVFNVMQGLACHPWGVQALFAHPGFLEFLANRSTETTKAGHEWKFAIIQSVVAQQDDNRALHVLDDASLNLLRNYLAKGVFYARSEFTTKIASKSS